MNLRIYTDGGARGNPGPAGVGVIIYDENNKIVEEYKQYLGIATNNVAEYKALVCAMELAKKYLPCTLEIHLDSELVCQQMLGNYKVKNENLIKHFQDAQRLVSEFEEVRFVYIPRDKNKQADRLVNQVINLNAHTDKI